MQHGSKGQSEHDKSRLGYWHVRMHSPFAVYHCLYLGVAKDFISWLLVRIGVQPKPKDPLIMPFGRPKDTHRLLQARRGHFVLRNKPDCIMVDFTQNLGSMTMSEMQLLFEVGVPYLCHDLAAFGVPAEAVTMWLLLRHGMLLLTRLLSDTVKEYRAQLKEAQACLVAFAAMAERIHCTQPYGASQFKFTWKLHVCCAHLARQAEESGHAMQASDTWVEQLMRQKACQICKCGAPAIATTAATARLRARTHCSTLLLEPRVLAPRADGGRSVQGTVHVQGQGFQGHRKRDPASSRRQPRWQGSGGTSAQRSSPGRTVLP
jgi:hypothetical protein